MLTLALLFVCTASCLAKNSYVIFTPNELRSGVKHAIGVNILKANSNVNVKAELTDLRQNVITSQMKTFKPDSNNQMELNIPDDLASGTYKLRFSGTGGLYFNAHSNINNRKDSVMIHIQTDKGIYKAGQTVQFRVFATYPNLRLHYGKMDIEVFDPKGNKIQQWLKVEDISGVYNGTMVMDKHPVLGDWKMTVKSHGVTKTKTFAVKEYVLPKFKVSVDVPSYILTTSGKIDGSVTAQYTFGKPVHGNVLITVKPENWPSYRGKEPAFETQSLRMVKEGKVTFTITLEDIKNKLKRWGLEDQRLIVTANVTESMTRLSMAHSHVMIFKSLPFKLEILLSTKSTFKPGLPFYVDVGTVSHDGSKIVGRNLKITLKVTTTIEKHPGYPYDTYTQILPEQQKVLSSSKKVTFAVDLPGNAILMALEIVHKTTTLTRTIKKYYTSTGNYIDIRDMTQDSAKNKIKINVRATIPVPILRYQVWARGNLVHSGEVNCQIKPKCNINFDTSAQMAPKAEIFAYFINKHGEIIVDAIDVPIRGIFENQVTLRFNKQKADPGENVKLSVTSDPLSFVYVLAVDQSVSLLHSGNDLGDTQISRAIETQNPLNGGVGKDTETQIKLSSANVLTDALVYKYVKPPKTTTPKPTTRPPSRGWIWSRSRRSRRWFTKMYSIPDNTEISIMEPNPNPKNNDGSNRIGNGLSLMKPVTRVRTEFPETWIWDSQWNGANGTVTFTQPIPDTITSWSASAFAVNANTGLGIPQAPAEITCFRKFFVSLNLPYSVIRGEEVVIQVNIFNYLPQDVLLMVILNASKDFQNIYKTFDGTLKYASKTETESKFVYGGKTETVWFPIRPLTLGLINIDVQVLSMFSSDGVQRTLLVEPEGISKVYNKATLLGVNFGQIVRKKVNIAFPPSLVKGSERVKISVIGDFMGPTVNNLDHLLRMPYGCGEQTMLNLAPNVFVANYLKDTNQITDILKRKLNNYIEKGYQRELTYQRRDGSFSAFGNSDRSGSMWLTAFVIKTFHKAKDHIFIDDKVIIEATRWIIGKQAADGSFPEPGRVIHREMQGGSAHGQQLTAFVLIALAENNDLSDRLRINTAIEKAKTYLERRVNYLHDNHAIAIVNYALYAAKSVRAPRIFSALNRRAINEGDFKYWKQGSIQTLGGIWKPLYRHARPIDIETSAYCLMLHAKYKLFGDGLRILKWLTQQRNPNGGFSSTQDTVVALESFSVFAASTKTHKPDLNVAVKAGQHKESFKVEPSNSLVLQSTEIPKPLPNSVEIEANGHGMAIADVSVFYNVQKDYESQSFGVTVTVIEETIDLRRLKACTRLTKGRKTGMAIQEVKIPTGFEVDEGEIKGDKNLKKIETDDKKVVLYYNEISNHPTCVDLKAIRTALVSKIKPSSIHVYDYYNPETQANAFYSSNILRNSSVCDVCKFCQVCRKYSWWLWK